jgi:hypothetical protein
MRRAYKAAIAAAVLLIALAAAGCAASAESGRQPAGEPIPSATTQASIVGFKWLVTSITSLGKQTPIPRRDQVNQVYVLFTANGHFGGDEPVNFHWGTYRLVGDGFTTSRLVVLRGSRDWSSAAPPPEDAPGRDQRSLLRSSSSARESARVGVGHRMQPLRQIAGVLGRTQASLGLQPGEDRRASRPLDWNQPGDRRSVLGHAPRNLTRT